MAVNPLDGRPLSDLNNVSDLRDTDFFDLYRPSEADPINQNAIIRADRVRALFGGTTGGTVGPGITLYAGPGTNTDGPMTQAAATNYTNLFGDANNLKGGLYSIQFYSQLAAILPAKRRVGMEANVWNGPTAERGKYTLAGDLTTWVKAGALLTQTAPVYSPSTLYNEASGYITFALSGGPRRLFLSTNLGVAALQPAPLSGALPGVVNAAWVEIADGTGNALFRPVPLAEAVSLLDLGTLVPGLLYAVAFPALAAQVAQTVWLQALDVYTFQGVGHVYADGTNERTKLVTADVRTGVVTVFSSGGGGGATTLLPWDNTAKVVNQLVEYSGGTFRAKTALAAGGSAPTTYTGWATDWLLLVLPVNVIELLSAVEPPPLTNAWNGLNDAHWLLRNGATRTLALAADFIEGPTRRLDVTTDGTGGNNLLITVPAGFTKYVLRGAIIDPVPSALGRTSYSVSRRNTEFRITVGPNYAAF